MEKTIYEVPEMRVFQVKLQGIIMNSIPSSAPANMTTHEASEWGDWE